MSQIPQGNLVPGAFTEIDNSGATSASPPKPHRALLIGIVPEGSGAPTEVATPVTSPEGAIGAFRRTQAAAMAAAYLRQHARDRVDVLALQEDGAAATGSLGITGTATEAGELPLRINGVLISVPVAVGDEAAELLTDAKARIDDAVEGVRGWQLLVETDTIAESAIPLTVTFEGAVGNDSTLTVASQPGEKVPAGLDVTVGDFADGSGAPDIADAIAALGDTQYDTIVVGFYDDANLIELEGFLTSRWDAMVQKDGLAFVAVPGTHGDLTTFAGDRGSPYLSAIGAGESPTPSWVWAAQYGAMDARMHMSPRPRFGQALRDCLPPLEDDRFDDTERQILLSDGVSTYRVSPGGDVVIERAVTTYTQHPASGAPDASYRNTSTLRNLAFLRWSWNALLNIRFFTSNAAPDGTIVNPGVAVVTPSTIKGAGVDWYLQMQSAGRVHSFDVWREEFFAEIDSGDPERFNVVNPAKLVAELVTVATRLAFAFQA